MKILCSRDRLIESIGTVQKAVATRSTLPILDGILIEVSDRVKLTGYDLETGIECFVEADVSDTGSIVINSRIFGDIVKKLPDDLVTIEVQANNAIAIESGTTKFSIKGIPAEGYPRLPVVENSAKASIPQKTLKDMIRQTLFAVSTDESRPILNGSYVVCDGSNLEIVSIDGFRLALRRCALGKEVPAVKFIVPGRALGEVGRILEATDDPVDIYPSQNHILFDTGEIKIVSRLIQGDYMNYRSIIPQTAETSVRISPQVMMQAMERASLVITSEDRRFPVRLSMGTDDVLVVSANTDVGALREEINVDMSGAAIDIDFNPRYFLDALRAVDDEEIVVSFNGGMGPCVLRPVEGDAFAYLVLPLRR